MTFLGVYMFLLKIYKVMPLKLLIIILFFDSITDRYGSF